MKVYIVRHGETEENLQHILQGHMPGTLTEHGKEQVRAAAERLAEDRDAHYKCILTSDLKRAVDSAEILQERLHIPVIPYPLLRERDWGKYTGITVFEACDKFRRDGKWVFPDSAESDEQTLARAAKVWEELQVEYPDDTVILVTHGLFARNLIAARYHCTPHEVAHLTNAEIRVVE
jgi:probable phosphoglycerate mutase